MERWSGVVAVALGDADTAIAAHLKSEAGTIYLGTTLFAIGSVAFLWFVSGLRERLAGAGSALATWAFAGGVLLVGMTFGFFALRPGWRRSGPARSRDGWGGRRWVSPRSRSS